MKQIDEDETLRQELIEKGIERSKAFSWDQSALKFWEVVENMMK